MFIILGGNVLFRQNHDVAILPKCRVGLTKLFRFLKVTSEGLC